jgi:hypothetical protein
MCNISSKKRFLDSITIIPAIANITAIEGKEVHVQIHCASRTNFSRLADSILVDKALRPKKGKIFNLRTLVLGVQRIPQCLNMCIYIA